MGLMFLLTSIGKHPGEMDQEVYSLRDRGRGVLRKYLLSLNTLKSKREGTCRIILSRAKDAQQDGFPKRPEREKSEASRETEVSSRAWIARSCELGRQPRGMAGGEWA